MNKLSRLIAGTLVSASLLSLTGCYSLTVQGADLDKPVSVSHSTGEGGRAERTFKHDMVTWYVIGLLPVMTIPGGADATSNADQIVADVLRNELKKGGDGVVDLKVTHEYSVISALLGALLGWLPVRAMGVTVEGKVVD